MVRGSCQHCEVFQKLHLPELSVPVYQNPVQPSNHVSLEIFTTVPSVLVQGISIININVYK